MNDIAINKEILSENQLIASVHSAGLPPKFVKESKKIGSFRKWVIWFLVFLCGYVIWWLRPANFPEHMPDESLFMFPEVEEIGTGENLLFSFASPEMNAFIEQTKQLWYAGKPGIVGFDTFPRKLKDAYLLEKISEDSYDPNRNLNEDILNGRVFDLSLDAYFDSLSGGQIQVLRSAFGTVSRVMREIEQKVRFEKAGDEVRFFDMYGDASSASYSNAQSYARTLNFLAGYACSKGRKNLCTKYLRASYLLGAKMVERNIPTRVVQGLIIREEALLTMLYLKQQGKIDLKEAGLLDLISEWQVDAKTLTEQTIKMNYRYYKDVIELSYLEEDFWGKLLFDKEETIKILQASFAWNLRNPVSDWEGLSHFNHGIDRRFTDHSDSGEDWSALAMFLWRKNSLGLRPLFIASLGVYDVAEVVEDYEAYLLQLDS